GLESRSFWLVLSSPNGGRALLWGKIVMSTMVFGGGGVLLTSATAPIFPCSAVLAPAQSAPVGVFAAALCRGRVGLSAALPRFVYDNPAHRVSAWALILGFFATVAYLAAVGLLFLTIWAAAGQMADHAGLIYALGAAAFLLLSAASILLPLFIGARRIE